jgi:hypothetical protein
MPRYFTIEEARAVLQAIRPLMDEIQAIRQEILVQQPEAWGVVQSAAGNGGNRAASRMVKQFDRLDRLVHQIQDLGAALKDINLGLLDFAARRGDREVCLCWKHGEPDLLFWHEADAGFAGRQPIDTF